MERSVIKSVDRRKKSDHAFHISFPLIDDESITAASALLIPYHSYPLNRSVSFKFTPKIRLRSALMLKWRQVCNHAASRRLVTKREIKSVL